MLADMPACATPCPIYRLPCIICSYISYVTPVMYTTERHFYLDLQGLLLLVDLLCLPIGSIFQFCTVASACDKISGSK